MARHWSINGRFLTQPLTGVQRYACEIVRALDALLAADHPLARMLEIELLVPKGQTNELPLRHIRTRIVSGAGGHLWEQLMLPQNVSGGLISLCNTGPIVLSKHIVCIHDLNTRLYPVSYSLPFRTLYRALLPTLGRTANAIATVSRFSADQLISYGIGFGRQGHSYPQRPRARAEMEATALAEDAIRGRFQYGGPRREPRPAQEHWARARPG